MTAAPINPAPAAPADGQLPGTTAPAQDSPPEHPPIDPRRVPTLETDLAPAAVMQRLAALSKRGKLAGFRDCSAGDAHRFVAQVFGNPYDRWLNAEVRAHGAGSRLLLRCTLARKFPAIMIGAMVLSIWPGLWLTDSMLGTYWLWYARNVETWWWYLPLMVLSLPPLWKQFRRSEAQAPAETGKVVGGIAAALGARTVEGA